jgi:uracil-DNA glycosylase
MTNVDVDIEQLKTKLVDKLRPSGWADVLKGFLLSSDFNRVLDKLVKLREDGKRFTPPLKLMFRAFEECNLDNLNVVIIGQDPYPQLGVADGLAFSCSQTEKTQPSLKFMFEELYGDAATTMDTDLTRWANQGVLLLNSALSVEIDKIGSHYTIWNDFLVYVIDMINLSKPNTVFILMGAKAQEFEPLIADHNLVLKVSHPAAAYHNQTRKWDSKDVFHEANRYLLSRDGSLIIW